MSESINEETAEYGLIGRTLSYSYSKALHEKLGRYSYQLMPMTENEATAFIVNRRFKGLNVTIPYKSMVIPLCDYVEPFAKALSSVNTLYFDNGRLCGTNTDYIGFLFMARRMGISFSGKRVLILGDGATSRTIQGAVRDSGAEKIFIATRRTIKEQTHCQTEKIRYEDIKKLHGIEILINATPVGTYPNNGESPVDLTDLGQCQAVIDVIYNPLASELVLQASDLGIPFSSGLPMLVGQATAAANLFLGVTGLEKENERLISELTNELRNIVLIGMPGSGKTTISRELGKRLNRPVTDIDEQIVKRAGMSIPQIFDKYGEEKFREFEAAITAEIGREQGQVIATGGGVVLNHNNMKSLKQNGLIVFLNRPLGFLATEGRPLSKDADNLALMQQQRIPLYEKYADLQVSCEDCLSKNIDNIIKLMEEKK